MSQFRPVYVDRYFIVLVPFLLPIIATGAQRLMNGWTELKPGLRSASGLAGTTALLVTTFGAIHAIHTQPAYAKEQWKEVAHWLQQLPSDTTVLLSEQEIELPLAYYAPDIQPKGLIQSGGCPSIAPGSCASRTRIRTRSHRVSPTLGGQTGSPTYQTAAPHCKPRRGRPAWGHS